MDFDTSGLKGSYIRPLTKDELYEAHVSSLEVLEKVGIRVYEEEALKLLEEAGCERDPKKDVIRIPQYLVKEAIKKVPSIVTLCGRNKKYDMKLGVGKIYTQCSGGVPYILDLITKESRKATIKDVADSARMVDALTNVHGVLSPVVIPSDVPEKTEEVYSIEATLNNTEKHITAECFLEQRISDVINMAIAVAGGEEELKKRPIISCLTQPVAPLQHGTLQTKILLAFAKKGLPLIIRSHCIAGFTSPVSIAGELVLTNSENLSSILIAQLVNPKTPIVYGMSSSTADMRTGLNLSGSIEIGLLGAAFAQLAKYYNLPSSVSSGIDSKIPDAQAVVERIMTALPPILAGIDNIWLCALDLKLTFSYEQLIIDDEIVNCFGRLLKGIKVNDESLAVDVINEAGPGGAYLTQKHTHKHYEEEHLIPKLFDRETRIKWEKANAKDIWRRASDKAKKILAEHQPEPLERDVREKLAEIEKSLKKI